MTKDEELLPPGLGRRLMAMLYDTFLVLPLVMVSVGIGLGLFTLATGNADAGLSPNAVRLLIMLTLIAFFSVFWLKNGQTLGMQAWRVKLVRSDGGDLALQHCLRRCVGAALSAACLGLGYLWCLVDRRGRYWHDYLSGSELVLMPKSEKSVTKT
ncbi:MAG: RDD family protein [Pseudomonadota bacterium]